MIEQVLGNYRITGVLGQGGMGIVYEGEHALIRRKVAIKDVIPVLVGKPLAIGLQDAAASVPQCSLRGANGRPAIPLFDGAEN